MRILKKIGLVLAIAFSVAYCHFATEILFNEEHKIPNIDFLKKEYYQSLIVGFCAGIPAVVGSFLFNYRKTKNK